MEVFIISIIGAVILGIVLFGRRKKEEVTEQHVLTEEERLSINRANDFKMIVEDIFTITGKGTVVTGKIESGLVKINETVELYGPTGLKRKVLILGVEMFRKTLNYAQAGDQVGLLLGDIAKNEIQRGDSLNLIR